MGTTQLESALAQMFPPNQIFYRRGWIWRDGKPTQIEYIVGSDDVGHQFMRELGGDVEMTPFDSWRDLVKERV